MTITVAGNKKDVAEGLTVAQLVIDENVETPQYVTVTINDEFVESGAFEGRSLKSAKTDNPHNSGRWQGKGPFRKGNNGGYQP